MPTTPQTRRSALRGISLTAIAAGLAVPALASKPDDGADAELIRLCDRLVQLRTYELELIELMGEDDAAEVLTEANDEWNALADRVRQIDRPLTLAGATAMARCVVRHSEASPDSGDISGVDLTDRMAIRVSEFLSGGEVA